MIELAVFQRYKLEQVARQKEADRQAALAAARTPGAKRSNAREIREGLPRGGGIA